MTDTTPDSIGALVERVRSAHMYLADRMVEIPEDLRVALLQSLTDLTRERDALREALTPSGDTKGAYHGEFVFEITDCDEDGEECQRRVYVPWTTTKEIMAAIHKRALRTAASSGGR